MAWTHARHHQLCRPHAGIHTPTACTQKLLQKGVHVHVSCIRPRYGEAARHSLAWQRRLQCSGVFSFFGHLENPSMLNKMNKIIEFRSRAPRFTAG